MDTRANKSAVTEDERRLSEEIVSIGALLVSDVNLSSTVMQERHFVHVFLPMFAGDDVQHYPEATPDNWRRIAGSGFHEVSVIDSNGAELFRVPPLFDTSAVKPLDGTENAGRTTSITDMMVRASLVAKQGPAAYNNFVDQELARRQFIFKDAKDESDYIKRWNAIFARYKRKLIGSGEIADAPAQADHPADFDSTEFEPL